MTGTDSPLGPDRISRDEAVENVGRELFGQAWVAEISSPEWQLAQQYKKALITNGPLPADPAAEQAHARLKRAERQGGEVGQWLENHGFDCVSGIHSGFDRRDFEATFKTVFGKPLSGDAMSVRDSAVLKRLRSGKRPGKGGNEFWHVFRLAIESDIRADEGQEPEGTSIKQLRRIVRELMKQHRLD